MLTCLLISTQSANAQSFVHPGLSHKKSDLDRMKMMVAAGKEPWKSSFANLSQNQYASYNYVVKGSPANTVIDQTVSSEYNKIKFDGLAAYYNSLMWYITGDERYAKKAVEIFNAWVNVKRFVADGTKALDAGRVIWKFMEAAEIIKSTYPGWQQADIDKFKAMLVYPGYSTTVEPTAAINSSDVTFYWYMYNGDPGRHGNQGIFAMRGIMAMGIFMDNRIMYERALRYLTAQPHRSDDLPYVSGPPIVSTTKASTSNQYFDEYTQIAPYQQTTIPDYGYDDQIQYYIDSNGQCEESSRDQSHPITGISILNTIAEMAWNQGDDMYSYLGNRILSGSEYVMHYNASYNYSFPDQPTPWEPTVASGEYTSRTDRSGRWTSLKINPYTESDFTRLTRGQLFKSDQSPYHELVLAHYRDRIGLPADKYKWTQRAYDISLNEFGYEGQGFEVDNPGYGGLTFHRANLSPGDPVQSFVNGQPVFGMNNVPATIEAENYDYFTTGGQGKTYNDADNVNTGGVYRTTEGVDISNCSEGGYAVANMQPGEWLNYTVAVPQSGYYKIAVRYSSVNANGKIRFDFDGLNATGDVVVPFGGSNSTGADDWKDFIVDTVMLQAGVQSMRIYVAGTESAFNLNNITLATVDPLQPPAVPSSLVAKAGNGQAALNWTASVGATSYKVKRASTSGGPYINIATVDTTVYTNTGLNNGTTYYYVVSAVNALGEGANSTEAMATPTDAGSLIEDNFETGLGSQVTGRIPEIATINNRVFQASFTGAPTTSTVISGAAQLATVMAEVIDISNADGFTKPTYINISGSFNEGTLANNTPARPARGVYFGFWSSLSTGTVGFQNMRGVFVNPEDGELQLWNGSSSTTGTPVQSISYQGTWDASAQHSISYTINTATGNISDFVLDGVTYLWNKTNIFTDANTNYAGFGTSGASSGQYGNIGNFKVKDNKVWNEVVRSPQTINFPDFSDKKIGDADFNTGASTNSGLPLTYISSNPSIATVATDGTVHIVGVGKDTITASQPGNTSYETATPVSRVLIVTKDGSAAVRLLVQDNFTTGDSVTNRKPDVATVLGRVYQKAKSVSTDKNLIVNGAAQLYNNMGEAIKIADTSFYTRPVYINVSDTFDLGTLTQNSPTPRAARGVYLGFWKTIPTSTSTSIDSYSQFYGVFVNPDGTLRLWNGKNKSDSTPVQTLAYIGTWSGGTAKHTLSYTINTTTGLMSSFVLDGVTSYAWKDTAIFTAANTNYAGFGVSGASSTNYGNIHGFKVTNVAPLLSQTIAFPAIATKQTGDADFNPRATASSGNPITYSSSNTAVATIVNGLVHIVEEGTATITATQAGNSDYSSASATQTLTVKRGQTITFNALTDKYVGDADFNLSATASSGLPVTYTSSNTAVATIVNGNQVHVVAQGNSTITASQAGDATYAAATAQTQLQVVKKVNQTITFNALPAKQVGDADFDPAATAASGLSISYTSGDESVATIVNGLIHIVGEGTILITASQPGDSEYNVASSITQTLTVTRQDQSITFNALAEKQVGEADFSPAATASSGLPVTYASSDESVATIVNGAVHIVGKGTTIITASQVGNAMYKAASPVSQQLNVYISPTVKTKNVEAEVDVHGNASITPQLVDDGSVSYSGTLSLSLDKSDFTCSDIGSPVTVTLTATDADGHASSATAQITIVDKINPTIAVPSTILINADNGSCSATNVDLGSPTTADNCGVQEVKNDAPASFPVGNTTVTWTITDIHGNQATAAQIVTVTDSQMPTITAPADVNANADNGSCTATNMVLSTPITSDNCGVLSVTNDAPANFPVGTTIVTWTVTDVHNNISTAIQKVVVEDNQKPSITAPDDITVNANDRNCTASGILLGTPITSDNCGIQSVINDAPASFNVGTTTVTWTVTDIHNNVSTAMQRITVVDNQNPTITAPATVNVNADMRSCATNSVTLGMPITADNCGVASITNDAPVSYPVGTTVVTWTVKDVHGNEATAKQNVTITDAQKPTADAPSNQFFCYAGSNYQIPALTASDNCGVATIAYSITGATTRSGSGNDASGIFNVGQSTITWTVTDVHNNTSTASATVTINAPISASIPDVYALNPATDAKNTLYLGYGPSSLTINVTANGGTLPYSYKWNTGQVTQSLSVSTAGTYSVTITDARGCTGSASIVIKTLDVTCGTNNDKVMVCHNGKAICVASSAVQEHLNHGDNLGACNLSAAVASQRSIATEAAAGYGVIVYPNPVVDQLHVQAGKLAAAATVTVYASNGVRVLCKPLTNTVQSFSVKGWIPGVYYVQIRNGEHLTTQKIIKH